MSETNSATKNANALAKAAKRPTALQYLDRALGELKALGFAREDEPGTAPIIGLLNQITDLDEDRVAAIARTLDQASHFNEVVREQVSGMNVGERYEGITAGFDSIREDAKMLVDQYADGKIGTIERVQNVWMKMTRGDIASRFDKIRDLYLEVADETRNQVERETRILEAYRDFRGALKNAEVLALEVLNTAEAQLNNAKANLNAKMDAVNAYSGDDPAERAIHELDRDEALRTTQKEEKRYQIAKDLSDNITVGYNTSEVIMTRLVQTTNAKERIYSQSISFFGTNETVLTALTATFTGMHGLHESTQTLEAMKDGINKSLETLSDIGGQVHEAAIKAGYGPTIASAAVKQLVESVITYQERSQEIIKEMRVLSTQNAEEIRTSVEDGKRRLARLVEAGAAAALEKA